MFLMLTDSDLTEMIKAVGVRRKLIIRRNEILKCDSSKVSELLDIFGNNNVCTHDVGLIGT